MKIGFVQNRPAFGDVVGNLDRIERLLAGCRADLIVLPELCATGYQFTGPEESRQLAEPTGDGPTARRLIALARETGAAIVAGLAERDGDNVYNSAIVVGPSGLLASYRKTHLFDTETKIFKPGDRPLPVIDLGPAKVGVMICFDWRFPEAARTLALKGADILAHPSNLVLPHCPQAMITRCLENRVFAVTANRVGQESRVPGETLEFIGQSQVVDPDGNVLVRASRENEEVHFVDIDPARARRKRINGVNDLFGDRRTDLYELN